MRLTLTRNDFTDATAWVARLIGAKPPHPTLGGILIKAYAMPNLIQFSAYDLETSAQVDLTEPLDLSVDDVSAQVLVSGRLLAQIARVLPKKGDVVLETSPSSMTLTCGKAEFTLPTMIDGDYPMLPLLPDDAGRVDAARLSEAISQVLPAIGRDEAVPQVTSVCIEVTSPSLLTLFCTDKNRVAIREVPWCGGEHLPRTRLLVPAKAVAEIARYTAGDVFLGVSGDKTGILGIHSNGHRTTTRLIDEKFPDCRKIIPPAEGIKTTVRLTTADLVESLTRAMLLDDQEYPRIKFSFSSDRVIVSGGQAEVGGFVEELDCDLLGEPVTFSVNTRYLLDALSALRTEQAVLRITDPHKPILVLPYEAAEADPNSPKEEHLHLIMPVAELA
ncbi:MAG: DNA polymerase III subunit beta [Mycolicibacter algericus]|uniref:DNA polymerase III subunit beta n=1 Tax=Mycolicibacter algericus TaxID=1288388 RepID=UPI003C78E21D